jgi:diadenosine tetraphosphatase ApaH/serine/threonine PP2A family protein phosphatase
MGWKGRVLSYVKPGAGDELAVEAVLVEISGMVAGLRKYMDAECNSTGEDDVWIAFCGGSCLPAAFFSGAYAIILSFLVLRPVRIACISDPHSNLEALTAVLKVVDERGVDAIFCVGDIVGYGADAAACVDLVRERCAGVVMGNHDAAVALDRDVDRLPWDGQEAALHNRAHLSDEQLDYLAGLPLRLELDGCTLAHATPYRPEAWMRMHSYATVSEQFKHFQTPVCFVGHTHVPGVAAEKIGVLKVRPGNRYVINVGSVGQPRDKNPRACVAFFDSDTFDYELVRVSYDVASAAAKIRAAGLSARLAMRLEAGE